MKSKRALPDVEESPIRRWRNREGLTQIDAARVCGVSTGTIINWENGVMLPDEENAETLKQLIGPNIIGQMRSWKAAAESRAA